MTEKIKNNILYLENKEYLKITGVENVISLNETDVNLMVTNQNLVIKGTNITAEKFCVEDGVLELKGNFNSIKYENKKEKQGFIKRIFK